MIRKNFIFVCLCICFTLLFFAGQPGLPAQEAQETAENAALPRQFRELYLGMSLEDLKSALIRDSYFNFRGDRDVSLLPARQQSLVETTGSFFIRRAFFQFRDGDMFIMSLTMDTNQIDHYSIFTNFVSRYGEPSYLDPRESVWENDDTRIAIERPLTVKYIDKRVFNDIIDESTVRESGRLQLRQEFLDEF
jgi:hypothetical protein